MSIPFMWQCRGDSKLKSQQGSFLFTERVERQLVRRPGHEFPASRAPLPPGSRPARPQAGVAREPGRARLIRLCELRHRAAHAISSNPRRRNHLYGHTPHFRATRRLRPGSPHARRSTPSRAHRRPAHARRPEGLRRPRHRRIHRDARGPSPLCHGLGDGPAVPVHLRHRAVLLLRSRADRASRHLRRPVPKVAVATSSSPSAHTPTRRSSTRSARACASRRPPRGTS